MPYPRLFLMLIVTLICSIQIDGGISGLTKFFRSNYKKAWYTTDTVKERLQVKHVAIEMNQLLHTNMRSSSDPKHFLAKIFLTLDKLFMKISATESLIFVFDGPPPFTKMQTQRSRRKASPDNSLLTPGTSFMNTMEDVMLCYILQRLHRPQFQNITIYVSGSRDPGEGELKIVDWVNAIMPSPTDSMIICGSDSDLVIQAIGFPNISNLTVFQNNGEKQDMFCDIHRVVDLIQRDLYSRKFKETKIKLPEITEGDRLDYMLLFILNGNDYLPKIRGITFHKILNAYSKVVLRNKESLCKNLVNFERKTFNFPLLYRFCEALSKEEMYTPSPIQIIPSCTEAFCSFAQKKSPDQILNWQVIEHNDGVCNLWKCSLFYDQKNYTSTNFYKSKKLAREELSTAILQDLSPDEYQAFLDRKAAKLRELEESKKVIIEEWNARSVLRQIIRATSVPQDSTIVPLEQIDVDVENHAYLKSDDESNESIVDGMYGDQQHSAEIKLEQTNFFSDCDGVQYDYVRDSDVEEYLKGLLWVLKMYTDGICPDISYSFANRSPPSPSRVVKYLQEHKYGSPEGQLNANTVGWIEQNLRVPESSTKSMSPEATSICVIPVEGKAFVPPLIKRIWSNLQKSLSDSQNNIWLKSMSYEDVIDTLQGIWDKPEAPKDPRESTPISRMKNQRRVPRSVRKEKSIEKMASKLNFTRDVSSTKKIPLVENMLSGHYDLETKSPYAPYESPTIMANENDCMWTVVNNCKTKLSIRGLSTTRYPYKLQDSNVPNPFRVSQFPEDIEIFRVSRRKQ